jgi:hypothetical protein
MLTILGVVLGLLSCSMSATNRVNNLLYNRCNNNETNCFIDADALRPNWISDTYPYQSSVVEYVTFLYTNRATMCTNQKLYINTTCSEYFCGDHNYTFFQNIYNGYSDFEAIAYHNAFITHCYYCNTTDRQTFQQLLANNSCPYFWRHNPNMCREYATDTVENLTQMDWDMNQFVPYYLYRRSVDPTTPILDLTNFRDVLNLTVIRNIHNDYLGEIQRGEFGYLCYCPSFNRFGGQCDIYTRILVPFSRELLPGLMCPFMFIFGFFFTFMVLIPIIRKHVRSCKAFNYHLGQLLQLTMNNMNLWAAIYTNLSIFCASFEKLMENFDAYPAGNTIDNIFSVLSFVFLALALAHLLALWSHIFDKSKNMMSSDTSLSIKNFIMLGVFYVVFLIILVIAIVGYIVYGALVASGVPPDQTGLLFDYFNIAMFLIAIVFMLVFAIGFLIYGIRMYIVLKSIIADTSLFGLKFTRFMIVVDVLFIHFMCWLIVITVNYSPVVILGPFMYLYVYHSMDISMFMVFGAIMNLLFIANDFRETYNFMCNF